MDIINFIFRLGVLFAIFGFIWFLINAGISVLRGNRPKTSAETYMIKFIRYFFMVDVTILFCADATEGFLDLNKLITAGLILLMYFIGKFQNAEMKSRFISIQGNLFNQLGLKKVFNNKAEIIVISASVLLFTLLVVFPQYASNPISKWFYKTIVSLEKAPLLGFIFKMVGFFFVLSIFFKLSRGVSTLLTGGAINNNPYQHDDQSDDDTHFDDYEELK